MCKSTPSELWMNDTNVQNSENLFAAVILNIEVGQSIR